MFGNMLMTGLVTPLCDTDETSGWENRPFNTTCPHKLQKPNRGGEILNKTIKKKAKRVRTAYTTEQLRCLENVFTHYRYVDADQRKILAQQLKVGEKSVKVWFQNRRMKEKRYLESSYDSSTESFTSPSPQSIQNSEVQDASVNHNYQNNEAYYVQETTANQIHYESINGQVQYDNITAVQYELPEFLYQNYQQYYQHNVPVTMPSSASIYYDTNVYPIEYYPNTNHEMSQNDYQTNWPCDLSDINFC